MALDADMCCDGTAVLTKEFSAPLSTVLDDIVRRTKRCGARGKRANTRYSDTLARKSGVDDAVAMSKVRSGMYPVRQVQDQSSRHAGVSG